MARRVFRLWLVVAAVLVALGTALVGGASTARASEHTDRQCSSGRPFCVSVTGLEQTSSSTASPHYMLFTVQIENTGGSALTNGKLTLTLQDVVAGVPQSSSAVFQPSPVSSSQCTAGSGSKSHVLTCTVPNLPAGGTVTYEPLIFQTSTTAAASETTMTAVASFKEKGRDKQPSDPQPDEATAVATTTYEGDADLDLSWAFPTATIGLSTSSADDQFSSFPFAVPASASAFNARLAEEPVSGTTFCPAGTCYGEIVTTHTEGDFFSESSPVHLTIVQRFLPSGKTANNIVVYHLKNGASTPETITEACVVPAGGGAPTNLPCRTVDIDRLPRGQVLVTIDAFSDGNGGWGVG